MSTRCLTTVSVQLRPDGQHVDYNANQENVGVWELYGVDHANPGTATKLSSAMAGIGVYDFDYSPDGARSCTRPPRTPSSSICTESS